MKIHLLCALGALAFGTLVYGQNPIPNPGFEGWTGNQPHGWVTSNYPDGSADNITPVTPGHTGNSALRGEVKPTPGAPEFPFAPLLESNTSDFGFPVSQFYTYLSMFYKFQPADTGDHLAVYVSVMDDQGTVIGGGFAIIHQPVDTFLATSIPITYSGGEPYRAAITVTINNTGPVSGPAIGGYFELDDLFLGGIVLSAGEKENASVRLQGVYPNPAIDNVQVVFSLLQSGPVEVDIQGLDGRLVSRVFNGELNAGDYQLPASLETLDGGLYLCRIKTGDAVVTRKIRVL